MKDELYWNKIFGAILGTLLILFGLRQIAELVFQTNPPAKPGYAIAIQEAGPAAEQADVPPDWGTVLPTADVNAGATISNKCKSCHNFDNGGPNMTGPNLWGVIGRKPGTHPGFAYSQAMIDFGNKIGKWDFQHIYEFIAGPQNYLNGTKMTFVGLKQRQDRINLIAWLRQQSSSPVPIPPPNPKAAAAAKSTAGTAPSPANNNVTAKPGPGGPQPVNGAAPTSGQTLNPTGVTPATGAAKAPSQVNPTPTGGPPK